MLHRQSIGAVERLADLAACSERAERRSDTGDDLLAAALAGL